MKHCEALHHDLFFGIEIFEMPYKPIISCIPCKSG